MRMSDKERATWLAWVLTLRQVVDRLNENMFLAASYPYQVTIGVYVVGRNLLIVRSSKKRRIVKIQKQLYMDELSKLRSHVQFTIV